MDSTTLSRSTSVALINDPEFTLKLKHPKLKFYGTYVGRHQVFSEYLMDSSVKDIVEVEKNNPIFHELETIYNKIKEIASGQWDGLKAIVNEETGLISAFQIATSFKSKLARGSTYFFRIRFIKLTNKSVIFNLKLLQDDDDLDSISSSVDECVKSSTDPSVSQNLRKARKKLSSVNDESIESPAWEDPSVWHNLQETGKFTGVVILCIIELASKLLWYTAEFILKVLQCLAHLLTVSTPIILRFIDFMTAAIGGLYWMLYMIWRSILDPRPLKEKPPDTYSIMQPNREYRPRISIPQYTPKLAIKPPSLPVRHESLHKPQRKIFGI